MKEFLDNIVPLVMFGLGMLVNEFIRKPEEVGRSKKPCDTQARRPTSKKNKKVKKLRALKRI